MSENRSVVIKINGKEIANNIRSINREWREARKEIAGMTRGTQEYNKKAAEIKRLKGILDDHNKSLRNTSKSTDVAAKGMGRFNGFLKKSRALFVTALGPLLAFTTAFAAFRKAKQTIQEFEVALDELQAITGLQGERLAFLKNEAIDTGKQLGKTGKEMLEAFKLVGSAQPVLLQNEKALAAVTQRAVILSQATRTDLGQSVADLTSIMNANGAQFEETDRYINALAAGSQAGAKEVSFLAQAFKNVGPVGKTANIQIEEQVALLELLGEKGIEPSKAGTQLRNIILELQKDTNAYTNGVFDYSKALDNLAPIVNNNVKLAERFGKENVVGASVIAQNRDRLEELKTAVTGTSTAYEQAAVNTDNSAAAQKRAEASLDALILKFSEGDGIITAFYDGAAFYLDFLGTQIDDFKVLFKDLVDEFSGLLISLGLVSDETEAISVVMNILKTSISSTFIPLKTLIQGLKNGFGTARVAVEFLKDSIKAIPAIFQIALNGIKSGANTIIDQLNNLPGVDIQSKFEIEEVELPDLSGSVERAKSQLAELGKDNFEFAKGIRDDFMEIWGDEAANKTVESAVEDIAATALATAEKVIKTEGTGSGAAKKREDEIRKAQEEIFKVISDVTDSAEEKEILANEEKFNRLLDMADQFGLDRTAIEEARNQELEKINCRYREAEAEANDEAHQAELDAEKKRAEEEAELRAARNKLTEQILEDAFELVSTGIDNREERELEALELRKEQGLIAEEEYEKQKLAIQEAAFKKKKAVDIAQAIINGALAITKVTAQTGVGAPFAIPGIIAGTAAQVAQIAAQKFRDGGVLNGPSHENGGMPVINPKTGRIEAELEGDEFIVRKRSVTPRTMPLLNAINRSNGNLPQVNYMRIAKSIYRDGGVFGGEPSSQGSVNPASDPDSMKMLASMFGAVVSQAINDQEIYIRQTKIEDAASRKAKAKKQADIRA